MVVILLATGGWFSEEATVQKAFRPGAHKSTLAQRQPEDVNRRHPGSGRGNTSTQVGGPGVQTELGDRKTAPTVLKQRPGTGSKTKLAAHAKKDKGSPHSRGISRGSGRDPGRVFNAGLFLITAYTADEKSTGKKPGHPAHGITATGTRARGNRTVAADWEVLPPGTVIEIDGLEGLFIVEDRGGAVQGRHIDMYIANRRSALAWGWQKREIWVVKWEVNREVMRQEDKEIRR